jgi:probable rRNA maturation factor
MPPGRRHSKPSVAIDLTIEAGRWPGRAILARLCRRSVDAALGVSKPKIVAGSELSLRFTNNRHIRVLNRRYRGRDKPTNVLSFPAEPARKGRFGPLLGDIVLADGVVASEARGLGINVNDHVKHLIIHGFLHLIGHDHDHEKDAAVMEGLEIAILEQLGIADPYRSGR